jgi:hypothetical protein
MAISKGRQEIDPFGSVCSIRSPDGMANSFVDYQRIFLCLMSGLPISVAS